MSEMSEDERRRQIAEVEEEIRFLNNIQPHVGPANVFDRILMREHVLRAELKRGMKEARDGK